jgi:GTP-binding protein YchF
VPLSPPARSAMLAGHAEPTERMPTVIIGIIGLPQTGKTTVFNALTGAHGDVGGYHGEQVTPGMVKVPDERLDALARLATPTEINPAVVEFEDIGGVFAHLTGAESSGKALGALREVDGILMVLRCFESEFVPELLGGVDPVREYRGMCQELLLADQEVIEKRLSVIEHAMLRTNADRDALGREKDLLERCHRALESEQPLSTLELGENEEKMLRSYSLVTLKPRLCLLNIGEDQISAPPRYEALMALQPPPLAMCAGLEMELMELEEGERGAFMEEAGLKEMAAGPLIRACYAMLGLCSFFTGVGSKLHAWTVRCGAPAPEAAGEIHTDLEKGFIRAEVISFEDLIACGGMKEAKAAGKLRMEGRDYKVQDGDVITFHVSK